MYLGQVLFQNYMWPTLEIHVQTKAASTNYNTTASMLLNVVKDNCSLEEDGLHVFQPHSKMSENLAKKASAC